MSKEFKNMDDLFQSAFADEATDVPAFVKTNIDKKLGFDRKNKFGSMFSAILLISIVTATTLYFTNNTGESNLVESTPSNENQINPTPTTEHTTAFATNETSNSELENNSTNQIHSSTNPNQLNSNQSKNNNNSHAKNVQTITSNSKNENDVKNSNDLNKPLINQALVVNQSSTTISKNGSDKNPINNFLLTGQGTELGDGKENAVSSGSSSSSSSSGNGNDNNNGIASLDSSKKTNENNSVGDGDVVENQSRNFVTDSTIKSKDDLTNESTESNDKATTPQVDVNLSEEKYNPWMLSLTGGLNLAKSTYTSANQQESDLYKNSTDDRPGFETNFEAKYRMNNGLTFGSGLGFTQFAENYHYNKIGPKIDTLHTYDYIYDLIDSTLIIDSTIATTNYDTTIVNMYNASGETKANYLSLPLSIGTQIIYKKFRFDLFALGKFNYLVSSTGGYILNDTFIPFTKTSNPIFKPWYIDLMLGATVHYQIFEKLYLSGTFRYRPAFGQMYQGTSFNKSLQYTHLGIGLTLKF